MALLYPWATKEYLLWQMTIGQVMLYHNRGLEMKYPQDDNTGEPQTVQDMTYAELAAKRTELRQQFGNIE